MTEGIRGPHLHHSNIQTIVLLVLCIKPIHEIDGKHAQMLIEELYIAIVDTLCNLFTDLMWCSALDHVQSCPSVLGLGS